jgi:tight adherence protein C
MSAVVSVQMIGSASIVAGLFVVWWAIATGRSPAALPLSARPTQASAAPSIDGDRSDPRLVIAIAGLVRRFSSERRIERIDMLIKQAGQPTGYSVDRMLAMKLIVSSTFTLLGMAVLVSKPGMMGFLMVTVGGLGGFMVPEMLLTSRATARRDEVQGALPDAIDQLTVTVRAGLSIDASILRVSQTVDGALGEELRRVVQDMRIGVSRPDALKAFAARIDVPELNIFVRALVQADTLGVPISTTLMAQAEDMRERRRQRSEEMAMKLPVKILAPTVLCILPALLLVVLGPAVIQLMRNLQV